MKKLILAIIVLFVFSITNAAEIKKFSEIDIKMLATDLQVIPPTQDNQHVLLYWWIPVEYWKVSFEGVPGITEADKDVFVESLKGYSILCIVQADVTMYGTFDFYTRDEIGNSVDIKFVRSDEDITKLKYLDEYPDELEQILIVLKPMLAGAMGSLGSSMHFYVLSDVNESGGRLIDPYKEGKLTFEISNRKNETLNGEIEFPTNSLFHPRKCPNGKDAHITWKYCPWTGQKLED